MNDVVSIKDFVEGVKRLSQQTKHENKGAFAYCAVTIGVSIGALWFFGIRILHFFIFLREYFLSDSETFDAFDDAFIVA